MHKQKINAFTLVELIVVITILAILWTIAFISLQWYSTDARDSTRVTDLSTIRSSLELYNLDAGKYPLPTNWVSVTYSGSTVWKQWTFWETVYANLSKLDKIPKDALTDKEYTYSVINKQNEYELAWLLEWDTISLNQSQANAWTVEAKAYTTWNYNGTMAKSLSWTTCSMIWVPTIIANDVSTTTDLSQIVTNKWLVYNGYKNLPSSFKESKFKHDGWFDFTTSQLIAYTDTWSCEALTSTTSYSARVQLLQWLQNAYSGTLVQNEWEIANIVNLVIDTNAPSTEVITYAGNFVNNTLWAHIIAGSSTSSSSSSWGPVCTPSYTGSILWNTWDTPYWIAVDSSWNVYTSNVWTHNVTKITPSGVSTVFASTWNHPIDMIIDWAWNLYTANYYSNNISKITPAGVSTIHWSTGISPQTLIMDALWNIYTANYSDDTVTKITPAWVSNTLWSTWSYPFWIVIDSSWNIYTSNSWDNTVTKITPAWVSSTFWTTWSTPAWMAIDSSWNIYVANSWDSTITKITPSWVSSTFANTSSWSSYYLKIDSSWNLYVTNFSFSSWIVNKISPSWVVQNLDSLWAFQQWLTVDNSWNIYITNSNPNNVSKLTYSCN